MKTKSTAKLPPLTTLHHESPTRVLAGWPPGQNPVLALLLGLLWAALLMLPAAKASASSVITYLYAFTGDVDGETPEAGLVQGTDGYFYGTTYFGTHNGGTVFKISAAGRANPVTCLLGK
ncbi:MAG TPA: choice-of-anchor tandem repeat GloVer-containing protein [Verrucomicrobiae bacterium]|jgi:uncharacterized repeat protein (TIGR03803 family)|nr:choice-of-anchor tandem repeat GloVer-containing protein [Verrucomicrobiae bacterium]